jgi:hypothetical protein
MKYFGLAAAALVMSISAFAGTEVITCPGDSASAGLGNSFAVGNVPGLVGVTSTCPTFSALPAGDTFVSLTIVLQTDYSGGTGGTLNTTQTTFSGSLADVLQATSAGSATGTGPAFAYTDTASCGAAPCSPNEPSFGSNYFGTVDAAINGGNYVGAVISETYTTAVTAGSVQAASDQVFIVLNYSTSAPEPGSLMLLGGGLLAAGLIGRKKLVRK